MNRVKRFYDLPPQRIHIADVERLYNDRENPPQYQSFAEPVDW